MNNKDERRVIVAAVIAATCICAYAVAALAALVFGGAA